MSSIKQHLKANVDFLLLFILLLVSTFLRVYNISNIAPYPDESLYLIDSLHLICNNWVWPKESMLFQPPFFMYIQAVIISFFGSDLIICRYISVIAGSLSVCMIYLLGKELYDRRVGLLSGVLLCFLNYHVLYSKITQIEALAIFFIIGTLYFFWKAYRGNKTLYFAAAGFFQGLAIDTKYAGFTVILAIILFIIWSERNWKFFISRKMLIFFLISFLVFLPVFLMLYINDVNIFFYNFIERQHMHYNSPSYFKSAVQLPLFELIIRGFRNYVEMLVRGKHLIPWGIGYQISAYILLSLTLFSSFFAFLKRKAPESYLFIFFVVSLILVLFLYRFMYYLLYSLIAYIIMNAIIAVKYMDSIKSEEASFPKIYHKFYLTLTAFFLISTVVVGVQSPIEDIGEFGGFQLAIDYVDTQLSVHSISPSDGTVGFVILAEPSTLNMFLSLHDLKYINYKEGSIIKVILKLTRIGKDDFVELDLDALNTVKPRYLVVSEIDYDYYFQTEGKKEVLSKYRRIFSSKMAIPHEKEYIVFVRKE